MASVRDNIERGKETSSYGSSIPSVSGTLVIDTGLRNLRLFTIVDPVSGYGAYKVDQQTGVIANANITINSTDNGIVTLVGASLTTVRTFMWGAAE